MAIADVIANGIDNFHYHRYDAVTHPQDHIRDGGRDLFDNGNIVSSTQTFRPLFFLLQKKQVTRFTTSVILLITNLS